MPIDENVELFLRVCDGHNPTPDEQRRLRRLRKLSLRGTAVRHIRGGEFLTNLQELDLSGTNILSLDGVNALRSLKRLDLSRTRIDSIEELNDLRLLTRLDLQNTPICSLKGIGSLARLCQLDLGNTQVDSLQELVDLTRFNGLFVDLRGLWELTQKEREERRVKLNLSGAQIESFEGLDRLVGLEYLNLSKTNFESTQLLSNLTGLETLDLSHTPVSTLQGLGSLRKLETLVLRYLEIDSLDGLKGLSELRHLNLLGTQIKTGTTQGLAGLSRLATLNLWGTNVRSLEDLGRLTSLRSLDLSRTPIDSLSELQNLNNLQELYLAHTSISSITDLNKLTCIQTLDLSDMQIDSLEGLSNPNGLKHLRLSRTSLAKAPQWFETVDLPEFSDNDSPLFSDNECLWQVMPGIYTHEKNTSQAPVDEGVPVNEAKVIFLGDGEVGKTFTIEQIESGGSKAVQTSVTHGVKISQFQREKKATINFWDFGGQEIMYSMHRCFLTERTCYVIVVSTRRSGATNTARRWLKCLQCFASESKVILAVNRFDGVTSNDINPTALKGQFSNLVEIVEYTATDSNDIAQLTRIIENYVDQLPSVTQKFPKSWVDIKNRLRCRLNEGNEALKYVTRQDFSKICQDFGFVTNDNYNDLLNWFNDLGICLSYYQDEDDSKKISNYLVLDPEWLTNALYIIVNNGSPHAQYGRISHEVLFKMLNTPQKCVVQGVKYTQNELNFILEVMRKFRLSLDAGNGYEFVPALCSNKDPAELYPKNFTSRVRCELRYKYLPDSVIHRLMVDCSKKLNLNHDKCWLKGLCVDEQTLDNLLAICRIGDDNDVLYIDVYNVGGEEFHKMRRLLRFLLNKLESINHDLNLQSTTWICSNDERKASFQLSTLIKAMNQNIEELPYTEDGDCTMYNIQELLGQVLDQSDDSFEFKTSDCNVADPAQIIKDHIDKRLQERFKEFNENPFLKNFSPSESSLRNNVTNNFNDVLTKYFGSPEEFLQLVQFVKDLQASSALTEQEKDKFNQTVDEVYKTRVPKEERARKLRELFRTFSVSAQQAINLTSNALSIIGVSVVQMMR